MNRVSNKRILETLNKSAELLFTINKSKLEYVGHIMRNPESYGLLQVVL